MSNTASRHRVVGFVRALCVLVLAIPVARAARASVLDDIARVAEDDSLVIAIDRASEILGSPQGRAVHDLVFSLLRTGEFERLDESWADLSAQLQLPPEKLVDALFGDRSVFVRRWTDDGASPWAMILTIDATTEKRLRYGLKPAPRQPVGGRQILTIEDGRFLLSTLGRGERDGSIRVLLAPSSARPLFLEMLSSEDMKPAAKDAPVAVEELRAMDADPPLAMAYQRGARSVSLVGRVIETGIELDFRARIENVDDKNAPAPWSRAAFDRLSEGRRLAIVEHNSIGWTRFMGEAGVPAISQTFVDPFTGGEFIGKKRVGTIDEDRNGAMRMAIAVEATDAEALAPHADRYMAGMFERLGYTQADAPAKRFDLLGLHPGAIRTVRTDGSRLERAAELFGGSLDFAWCLRGRAAVAPGNTWWISGTHPGAVESVAEVLSREDGPDDERGAWVLLAQVEPAALLKLFNPVLVLVRAGEPDSAAIIDALEGVTRLTAEVRQTGHGTFVGSAGIGFGGDAPNE